MIYKIYTFIIILENSMCWKWDELIEGKGGEWVSISYDRTPTVQL